MSDEQAQANEVDNDQVPQDSPPVDGTVSTNNPHPVDEDPEQHIGDEQKDPWDDKESDWREDDKVQTTEQPADESDRRPFEQNQEDNA